MIVFADLGVCSVYYGTLFKATQTAKACLAESDAAHKCCLYASLSIVRVFMGNDVEKRCINM